MGFLKKVLKNKKASELTEKIMVTAFAVAASSAVIVYMSNVIIESKNADLSGTLNAAERNKMISDAEGTEGLVYQLNGSEYIVKSYLGTEKDVVIPSEHEGLPVTKIANYAFSSICTQTSCGIADITSVHIGYGVTEIGELAFEGVHITSVSIPDSVTTIGMRAFRSTNITSLELPNSVTYIGEQAFDTCYGLTSITLPSSNPTVGRYAFCHCDNVTTINIPEGITRLYYGEFAACISLTTINFPSSLTTIEGECFFNAFRQNECSIYIPNTVTSIAGYTFSYCPKVTINCQASSKPNGWNTDWNKFCQCYVNWGV